MHRNGASPEADTDDTPTAFTPGDELPQVEEAVAVEEIEAEAAMEVEEIEAEAAMEVEELEAAVPAEPEPEAPSAPSHIKLERVETPLDPDTIVADPDAGRLAVSDALAPKRTPGVIHTEEAAADGVRTAKVIAFANQKGGVAKTTTTLNLAVAFAESGHRVLAIDLDPQGNLTMSQGIDPDKVEKSMFDVLVHKMPIAEIVQKREIDIAVGSIDLAGAEIAMSTQIGRERSLEKAINEVAADYDFVCIDTPPSLGLLTVNALTAADKVIVPVQCEYLSMRGLVQLQNTLEMIRENLNPGIEIEGILPTMLDARTVHAKEAVEILEENFGELVFKSRIRKAIKFAEAPVRGASVLKYDPKSTAAESYRALAKEVLTHGTA
ncbi:MAG: ParA family protein [Solirubrobacterales bacterium]